MGEFKLPLQHPRGSGAPGLRKGARPACGTRRFHRRFLRPSADLALRRREAVRPAELREEAGTGGLGDEIGRGRREERLLRGPADAAGRKCCLRGPTKPVLIPGGGTQTPSGWLEGGRLLPRASSGDSSCGGGRFLGRKRRCLVRTESRSAP